MNTDWRQLGDTHFYLYTGERPNSKWAGTYRHDTRLITVRGCGPFMTLPDDLTLDDALTVAKITIMTNYKD